MRISRRNQSLLCVCSASLALGPWALPSAQSRTSASAGPPRIPQNENGMQVYLRASRHAPNGRAGGLQATTGSSASVM
jgi:hypothetical protein